MTSKLMANIITKWMLSDHFANKIARVVIGNTGNPKHLSFQVNDLSIASILFIYRIEILFLVPTNWTFNQTGNVPLSSFR